MSAEALTHSLEAVAAHVGDPVPLIYQRLFTEHPEMEPLFALDRDSALRGNMVAEFLDCLMDLAGARHYAVGYLQATRQNHDDLGVPPEVFPAFFEIVRGSFREALGPRWTAEMEAAWDALYADFAGVLELETA